MLTGKAIVIIWNDSLQTIGIQYNQLVLIAFF